MAGFVQLWSAQQLQQGASGCPNHLATTGPNTHAIVISNDSECLLSYVSDVDPGLLIPPRTAITVPCSSNMQYVLSVDDTSVPTSTSNQLVILSESNDALAYAATPLPIPNLVQSIETLFPGSFPVKVVIPPQFTAIILVPIDTQNLQVVGSNSTYQYYNDFLGKPITLQLFPGLDPSGLLFNGTGGQVNIYGLTVPLTEIGTAIPSLATIVAPVWQANSDNLQPQNDNVLEGLSFLYAWTGQGYDRVRGNALEGLQTFHKPPLNKQGILGGSSSANAPVTLTIPGVVSDYTLIHHVWAYGWCIATPTPVGPRSISTSLYSITNGWVFTPKLIASVNDSLVLLDAAFDPPLMGDISTDITFTVPALGTNITSRILVQFSYTRQS